MSIHRLWHNSIKCRIALLRRIAFSGTVHLSMAACAISLSSAEETAKGLRIDLEIPRGHVSEISELQMTGDGKFAVSRDNDGTVVAWDLDNARSMGTLPVGGDHIAVAAEAPVVVILRDHDGAHELKIYDLVRRTIVETISSRSMTHDQQFELFISHATLSPDARHILLRTNSDFIGLLDRKSRLVTSIATKEQIAGEIDAMLATQNEIIATVDTKTGSELVVWQTDGRLIGRFPLPCPKGAKCSGSTRLSALAGIAIYELLINWDDQNELRPTSVIGAFDLGAARHVWSYNVSGATFGYLTKNGARLVADTGSKRIALDPLTGRIDDSLPNNKLFSFDKLIAPSPDPTKSRAIVHVKDGLYLQSIVDGKQTTAPLAAPSRSVIGVSPIAQSAKLAVVGEHDVLHVDLRSGAVKQIPYQEAWVPKSVIFSSDGRKIFGIAETHAASRAPVLYSADVLSGRTLWKRTIGRASSEEPMQYELILDPTEERVALIPHQGKDAQETPVSCFSASSGYPQWTTNVPLKTASYEWVKPLNVAGFDSLWLVDSGGYNVEMDWSNGTTHPSIAVPDISLLRWMFPTSVNGQAIFAVDTSLGQQTIHAIDWSRHIIDESSTTIEHHSAATGSGKGKMLFGGTFGSVSEVDLAAGLVSTHYAPHSGIVVGVVSLASEDRVASVSKDGVINISQRSSGRLIARVFLGKGAEHITALPTGFFSGDGAMVREVSARAGQAIIPPVARG